MTRRLVWAVGLLAMMGGWLWGGLRVVASQDAGGSPSLARPNDPVIVTSAVLTELLGAPVNDLVLYRYEAGAWEPVLFQVDEVDASGTYTSSDGGTLDPNDEVVFIAQDAGAASSTWPDDAEARSHPRYALRVTDPLDPSGEGWAYLYRSTTLPRAGAAPYVTWEQPAQRAVALSYTAAFSPSHFAGLADLTLNGVPVDVLDRQKLRLTATLYVFGVPVSTTVLTEETIGELITTPLTITLPITGPVRAIGGSPAQHSAFYGARYEAAASLPLTDVPLSPIAVLHVDRVRTSLDWNDPASTGMAPATYFDENVSAGVAVDGAPDTVPPVPPTGWYQVSGGVGGLVVVEEVEPASGMQTTFYRDDASFDPEDTGDGQRFGDAGVRVDDPDGTVHASITLFVLPPGSPNVGATYEARTTNPLAAEVLREHYDAPATPTALPPPATAAPATPTALPPTATLAPPTPTGTPPSRGLFLPLVLK